MSFLLYVAPVLSFLLVLVLIPPVRELALRNKFVDEPDERKLHEGLIPPVGGLVIFPVYMLISIFSGVDFETFWPLYLGLTALLVTGALDDRFHVNAWVKFAIQIAVAVLVVIFGDARLYQLGNLFGFGDVGLDFMSIPFSVAAVVLLINAINLMDGLDGLAAGKSFVVLGWLILASVIVGEWGAVWVMAPMMGALLGFLFYNMRHPLRDRATIFLGDAGSMGLGLVLAWFCVGLAQEPLPVLQPISIAWILALPIIDACGQFFRRIREGRHPFSPDRGHFHHHFIHAGIPVGRSVALILMLGFALGAIGYFGSYFGVPEVVLTLVWIGLLFSHMALSAKPNAYVGVVARFFSRHISGPKTQPHD